MEKQPWEMTREEWAEEFADKELFKGPLPAATDFIVGLEWAAGVQRALVEGKRPPADVVKQSIDEFGGMKKQNIPYKILIDYAGEIWADKALLVCKM